MRDRPQRKLKLIHYGSLFRRSQTNHFRSMSNSGLHSQLFEIRAEQRLMESALALLQEELATSRIRAARIRNALQPCHRIPTEILSAIFEVGAPNPEISGWPGLDGSWSLATYTQYRESISATCSLFRSTILRTPRCWANIRVPITGKASLQALEVWLQRSRPCEFALMVSIQHHSNTKHIEAFASQASVLLRHMYRCRSLVINNTNGALSVLDALFQGALFSSVQHLIFHSYQTSTAIEHNERQSILPNIQSMHKPLHSLSIEHHPDRNIDLTTSLQQLSLRSLTRLRLWASADQLSVLRIIRDISRLEHFTWNAYGGATDSDMEILHLPYLKSLRLEDAARNLFPSVDAPLLEQVVLPDFGGVVASLAPDFMFRREQPHLPSLKRFAFSVSDEVSVDSIVNFIRSHPGLLELDFRNEIDSADLSLIAYAITMPTLSTGVDRNAQLKKACFFLSDHTATEEYIDPVVKAIEHLFINIPDIEIQLDDNMDLTSLPQIKILRKTRSLITDAFTLYHRWPDAWRNLYHFF